MASESSPEATSMPEDTSSHKTLSVPESAGLLELTANQFRELLDCVGERLGSHLATLSDQPSWNTERAEQVLSRVDLSIPESGQPVDGVISQLFDEMIPCSFNTAGPGYLAYIPGGGLPHASIADLISALTNRYMGVWAAAPVLATLESSVIRWLCDQFNYPSEAGGYLATGGSLANWTAMIAAREKLLGENFLDGVVYTSDQAHHCVEKAARLCGIPAGQIRLIASDDQCRIDLHQLRQAIRQDRKAGLRPFFVAATGGSTNTGAVDALDPIGEICREFGLWFHVDAAYGGFFVLTERGRSALAGIGTSDSITLDPHKGMFLPYGTGCLLVRRQQDLRDAHQIDADYMPARQIDADRVDFNEISPELSRGFRGLRVWLPLKLAGIKAFRELLDEKLDLTHWTWHQIERLGRELPGQIIIDAPPQLSLFAFHWVPPEDYLDSELDRQAAIDAWNQSWLDRINARKRVYMTATRLRGRLVIRVCVLSFRTHLDRMEMALEDIRQSADSMLGR